MGEHLGRNIRRQLEKCAQLEELAPCGDPHCAGCYVASEAGFWMLESGLLAWRPEIRIHPPRSEY